MVTSSDAHAAPRLQEAKERCGSQLWLAHTRTQPVLTDTNTSTIKTIHCNPKSLRQTDRERERSLSTRLLYIVTTALTSPSLPSMLVAGTCVFSKVTIRVGCEFHPTCTKLHMCMPETNLQHAYLLLFSTK